MEAIVGIHHQPLLGWQIQELCVEGMYTWICPRPHCLIGHLCLHCRWACLRFTLRFQKPFQRKLEPSFYPVLSLTPTNVSPLLDCSKRVS